MIKLLLLQVLFWSSGQTFASTSASTDLDSNHGVFFQEDHNDKALILEEVSEWNQFEISSEKETNQLPGITGHLDLFKAGFSENETSTFNSEFLPDQKNILKSRIFPFHYFW